MVFPGFADRSVGDGQDDAGHGPIGGVSEESLDAVQVAAGYGSVDVSEEGQLFRFFPAEQDLGDLLGGHLQDPAGPLGLGEFLGRLLECIAHGISLPRRCSGLQSIVAQGRGVGFWSFRRLGCHPAMVRADCLREEVTANECLGTKAQVPEKMNAFFDGLAHRKDEVRHRCRTLLQARADALMFTPAVPLPPLQNVVPTLALV